MKTCPACGFHNTQERERCLKCGAVLEHDWSAAQHKVRLRRFPVHRAASGLSRLGYALRRQFEFPLPENCPYRHPWTAGFLSLLPGAGQIYNRQYRKAFWFFAVFAAFFYLTVVTILHPTSYLFIAGLAAWILYAFNDAMVTAARIDGQQWTRGYTIGSYSALLFYVGVFWSLSQFFLVGIFLGFILYCLYSIAWGGGEVNRAKILTTLALSVLVLGGVCVLSKSGNPVLHRWVYWNSDGIAPTLQRGDFFYVDCATYWFRPPRVGEVIYYNPRRYTIERGGDMWSVNLSRAVERVVALGGDRFVRKGGVFYRNGNEVPPEHRPLNPDGLPDDLEIDVPAGRFLVFISYGVEEKVLGGLGGTHRAPSPREGISHDWAAACLVAPREIYGRCLFIWHPIHRRRWLTPGSFPPHR